MALARTKLVIPIQAQSTSQIPPIQPAVPHQGSGVKQGAPKTLSKGGNLEVPYPKAVHLLPIATRSVTPGEELV